MGTLRRYAGTAARAGGFILVSLALIAGGYALHGVVGGRWGQDRAGGAATAEEHPEQPDAEVRHWTCPMHPQIQRSQPSKCPLCGMDLVPVKRSGTHSLREFATSEAGKALMDIEVSPVERRFVAAEVRMVGKVAYDETRLAEITAWVPGRIDRLFVDYTGITVRKGDHMVTLYSPELLSAQQELIQALQAVGDLEASDMEIMKQTARATVEAAREKLRLWGLTAEQVAEVERRGAASDQMTIYAPAGGVVVHRSATQGMYVQTGTRIYTIADLSKVWIVLDAYESDLQWLRCGQAVTFTAQAYPGDVFHGRIAFIDPILDTRTRTVKVRVNVDNADSRLKPEMFVRAVVASSRAADGKVMDPDLVGKWICPMHPEVVKDGPGTCDVCGMDLVPAESLGYVAPDTSEQNKPLVVPATAPLITGTRAVVYVAVPDAERPTYEGREILLGPRAGDHYIVRHGLTEGELVVTRGNFKIDSALQIERRPSMMSPEGGTAGQSHQHGAEKPKATGEAAMPEMMLPEEFHARMMELEAAYRAVTQAVKSDDLDAARQAFAEFGERLQAIRGDVLPAKRRPLWNELAMLLGNDAVEGQQYAEHMKDARRVFESLTGQMKRLRAAFPMSHGQPAAEGHRP